MKTPWPLVGRRVEIGLILEAADRPGCPGVVLSGDPGVGKTRLAQEVMEALGDLGHPIEWAVATRAAATIPLGAFAHLIPPSSYEIPDRADTDPLGSDRLNLLASARHALLSREHGRRLVIGVDNAHLLDEVSATLVLALAQSGRCFVVVTTRHGDAVPDPITTLWKDAMAEWCEVTGLQAEEINELVERALDGRVDIATQSRLWDSTRGNPLYLRELVLGGLASGSLVECDGLWSWQGPLSPSPRLLEIIGARLGQLEPEVSAVLELLAIGEPLEMRVLETMARPSAVHAADVHGLLELASSHARVDVRLSHPLYSEVIRARLPPLRSRELQHQLADALDGPGASPSDRLRVANWRLDTHRRSDSTLLTEAAAVAEASFDHVLASRLAGAALEAGGGYGAAYALGRAQYWQGLGTDAERALVRAEQEARTDRERAQATITRASNLFWCCGHSEGAGAAMRRAEADVADRSQRDELVAHRASFALFAGRADAALTAVEPLLGSRSVSPLAELRALLVAVPAWAVTGRLGEAEQGFGRGIELALAPGHGLQLAAGQLVVSQFLALEWAGRLADGIALAHQARTAAASQGLREGLAVTTLILGLGTFAQGRVRSASHLLHEASTVLGDNDVMSFRTWALANLAQVEAHAGRPEQAAAALEAAEGCRNPAVRVFDVDMRLAEAWVASAEGRTSEAAASAMEAARLAADRGLVMQEAVALHDAVRLGRSADASRRLDELATLVEGRLVPAFAEHAASLVAGDGGRIDYAASTFEHLGANLLAAEATAEAAATYRRAGQRGRARSCSARMGVLVRRCQEAATPVLLGAEAPDELTVREREIALLAAGGLPSKVIAERLVLSVRTVNNHLAHVYSKLGIARRADLGKHLGIDKTPAP